jgi:hypothetical protein
MAQLLQVKNKGLYTSPNEFSSVPDGALVRANNCIITVDNIIESRRGNDRIAVLPDANYRYQRFDVYQDQIMSAWSSGGIGYKSGTVFTALSGTYLNPSDTLARRRFLSSQSNLYFTSAAGVYKISAYNATPRLAGMYKGLDVALALTGASGFLATANQTAYRVVFGTRDAQDNLILGAPSGRAVISNGTGGSRDVTVTFTLPTGLTTSDFFQVYRSQASGGATVEPDDELGLVYENNPTAGEIVTGTVSFTDSTTDDLLGATIYTALSEEGGAQQGNERPPMCDDFELFNDCVVYANTATKHRRIFTILACGGAAGIANNDTLVIAGTTYTAKTAGETIASGFFNLVTGGTPAQNIFDTAASLVRVINRYTSNTSVYAYYLSAPGDLPGQILIEERGLGGSSFAVTASAHGTAYNPVLPTSGTSVSSSNDDFQNGLMFSKSGKGEAVPLVNVRRVGSANNAIRRVKKLRNSCFIFKEREGIYRMTGTSPDNFQIELFDSSAKLIAPDSVAVVNNQIWCLCDQGITVVTETGVSVVSRPVEDLILDQFGLALDAVRYYSFGVGYETERQYMLWTVSSSSDTVPQQALVFNIFTQAYTRWPIAKTTAFVSPVDDKLYLGSGTSYDLEQERKSRNYTDYVDYGTAYVISSFTGTNVYLTTTNEIEVGDLLYQSASVQSLITDVQPAYVTVQDELTTWVAGAATVYKGIPCELEYAAITGANPGTAKQFPEVSLLFKAARFNTATVGFATDVSGYFEDVEIQGSRGGLWGLFPWGSAAWGATATTIPIRTYVPLEKQRGSFLRLRFTHRQGYGYFKLLGFSIPIRDTSSFVIAK